MIIRQTLKVMRQEDSILLVMALSTLILTMIFLPLRLYQGEYRLVATNGITLIAMASILTIIFIGKIQLARNIFAIFIGIMMILIVALNGPFQLNWVFAGMTMLYFTMRAFPALFYSQAITCFIAVLLWNEVDIQRWLQDLAALNITIALVFYGSLTRERFTDKIEKIADDNAKAATVDALTGLANRRAFDDKITEYLSTIHASSVCAALIYIDIDNFKTINDRYGHSVGDDVLKLVAGLIQHCVRQGKAFRIGGEEFVALVECSTLLDAQKCAERIRETIENHPGHCTEQEMGDGPIRSTVSIGVALYHSTLSCTQWLQCADSALYVAKNSGRNCIKVSPCIGENTL